MLGRREGDGVSRGVINNKNNQRWGLMIISQDERQSTMERLLRVRLITSMKQICRIGRYICVVRRRRMHEEKMQPVCGI